MPNNATTEAVRYLLEQQLLVRAPLRQLGKDTIVHPTRPSGGNFIFIAAYNSRPDMRATADFLCDGSNDDVEWLAAHDFVALYGGIIVACAGDYFFGNTCVPLTQIRGSMSIWGDGRAIIHHTASIPSAGTGGNQGRFLFRLENMVAGSLSPNVPTWTMEGIAMVGDGVAEAAGIQVTGPSQKPHVRLMNLHMTGFRNRFIYADVGNLTRFEIGYCQFEDSNIDGGGNEAPQMACIQLNSGSANYAASLHDSIFDNIQFPAYFSHLAEFAPTGSQPNSIYDNMVISCDTPAFNADAVYNNWINGTFTP